MSFGVGVGVWVCSFLLSPGDVLPRSLLLCDFPLTARFSGLRLCFFCGLRLFLIRCACVRLVFPCSTPFFSFLLTTRGRVCSLRLLRPRRRLGGGHSPARALCQVTHVRLSRFSPPIPAYVIRVVVFISVIDRRRFAFGTQPVRLALLNRRGKQCTHATYTTYTHTILDRQKHNAYHTHTPDRHTQATQGTVTRVPFSALPPVSALVCS